MNSTFKIVIATLIWGSLGVLVKQINLPSLEIAFLRAVIATLVLGFAGIHLKPKSIIKGKNLIYLLASGAAIGLNWILLFQSYKYTTIANATLSYYFAPVFVVILSPFVLKEKFTKIKFFSVLGAMTGLFLILSHQPETAQPAANHFLGICYGLAAATIYATVIFLTKKFGDLPGDEITLIQVSIAALVLLPLALIRNNLRLESFQVNNLLPIFILGAVHTGLAYLLYFSSFKKVKAQNIAILSYLDPMSALIFIVLFLD